MTALEVREMMAFRLDTDLAPALAMLLLSLPRFAAARTTCQRECGRLSRG